MYQALVVDDEPEMAFIIGQALSRDFTVLTAHDGATALNLLRRHKVDVVVLDVLMAAIDGLTVCRMIRATSDVPIILVTALSHVDDVVRGLEHGADDYVAKPFDQRELALRAAKLAARHRGHRIGEAVLRVGRMVIDLSQHTVTFAGEALRLPYTEFRLLAHLTARAGKPQSWQRLRDEVWGDPGLRTAQTVVKSSVYRLRTRLAEVGAAEYVQTVHGVGYLVPDISPDPDSR
jgi:DNA-binding response OmpR family regulator